MSDDAFTPSSPSNTHPGAHPDNETRGLEPCHFLAFDASPPCADTVWGFAGGGKRRLGGATLHARFDAVHAAGAAFQGKAVAAARPLLEPAFHTSSRIQAARLKGESMIPRSFVYHAPDSVAAAIALLRDHGDQAKLLAGGHSLLPMMKLRFAAPDHLIDLGRIASLRGITLAGEEISIGAMTSEREVLASPLLAEHLPLLVETARQIADPQVRSKGTIGGDIAHGDPGNDHPAVMLALGAQFVLAGPAGERVVAAADFFLGTYVTALEPDEVMTAIRIPKPAPGSGACYAKLKRKTGDYATAAAAVVLRLEAGVCADVAIGLTNVAPTAMRAEAAEAALIGRALDDAVIAEAGRLAAAACEPAADLRGDEEYKRAMAGQMVQRALRTALSRCTG